MSRFCLTISCQEFIKPPVSEAASAASDGSTPSLPTMKRCYFSSIISAFSAPRLVPVFVVALVSASASAQTYVWVANQNSGIVGKYDVSNGAAVAANLITGLNNPYALAIDSSGRLYVANEGDGTVGVYNAATGAAITVPLVTVPGGHSDGIAVDGNGTLFVSDRVNHTITRYNAANGSLIGTTAAGINQPYGLALDGAGSLFAVSPAEGKIAKYNASTGALVDASFVTGLHLSTALAIGGGNIYTNTYAGNNSNASIAVYSLATGSAVPVGGNFSNSANNTFLEGVALDGSGNLLVSHSANPGKVFQFNASTGALNNASFIDVGTFGGFGPSPQGLLVSAIPEPSTYAAVLGCLAGAGTMIHRRRRPRGSLGTGETGNAGGARRPKAD